MENDRVYRKLAQVLDTLPNGFPATPDGLEIRILKKIFAPEEAELFCDLKLRPETAEQIAARTGRPLEGLEDKLSSMARRGEILGVNLGGTKVFGMLPWAVGIYEFQINRLDREFCELCEQYAPYFGPGLLGPKPQIMQTVPIEETVPAGQEALPYEHLSALIRNARSFRVNDCICKKERGIMGEPCSKPVEVCLSISPFEGAEMLLEWGRPISREEALDVLRRAEDAGLVHLTSNVASGHLFICNCCGCCCGVLRSVNEFGLRDAVNSRYYAVIDEDLCDGCAVCADERCQVNAIEQTDLAYRVVAERCIGCGLCVTACPLEAIRLVAKPADQVVTPPPDAAAWNDERARLRGVDYSPYR